MTKQIKSKGNESLGKAKMCCRLPSYFRRLALIQSRMLGLDRGQTDLDSPCLLSCLPVSLIYNTNIPLWLLTQ